MVIAIMIYFVIRSDCMSFGEGDKKKKNAKVSNY